MVWPSTRSSPWPTATLRAGRAQPHLDPLLVGVEAGDMLVPVRSEVGVQLAVHDVEDVAVEGGGDAGGVVVGRLQPGDILHQVGAKQQAVAWRQQRGHL